MRTDVVVAVLTQCNVRRTGSNCSHVYVTIADHYCTNNTTEEVLFELIKSKCLPILLYGTDVCPMNSADRHSLQFTINKIVYKIFGAMSKDIY